MILSEMIAWSLVYIFAFYGLVSLIQDCYEIHRNLRETEKILTRIEKKLEEQRQEEGKSS